MKPTGNASAGHSPGYRRRATDFSCDFGVTTEGRIVRPRRLLARQRHDLPQLFHQGPSHVHSKRPREDGVTPIGLEEDSAPRHCTSRHDIVVWWRLSAQTSARMPIDLRGTGCARRLRSVIVEKGPSDGVQGAGRPGADRHPSGADGALDRARRAGELAQQPWAVFSRHQGDQRLGDLCQWRAVGPAEWRRRRPPRGAHLPDQSRLRERGRTDRCAHAGPGDRPPYRGRTARGHRHHQQQPAAGALQPRDRDPRRFRRHLRGQERPHRAARSHHDVVVGQAAGAAHHLSQQRFFAAK